jgi:hypothetical protein
VCTLLGRPGIGSGGAIALLVDSPHVGIEDEAANGLEREADEDTADRQWLSWSRE